MKDTSNSNLPPETISKLQDRLTALNGALLQSDPNMPHYLRDVHQMTIAYPESAWLLTDDEIKSIIDGAKILAGKKIIEAKTTKPKAGAKGISIKNKTTDDF